MTTTRRMRMRRTTLDLALRGGPLWRLVGGVAHGGSGARAAGREMHGVRCTCNGLCSLNELSASFISMVA